MDEASIHSKMTQVVDLVIQDVGTIRGTRASPGIVEDIVVSVYHGQQKLKVNELATITASSPESLIIDPWDKSIISEIKKGIEVANIGLTPNVDGEIIRINIPPMTGEDREKFVKLLGKKLESGKVLIRQIRGEAMHDIKKKYEAKELSEDEKFGQEKRIQEITDEFINKIESIGDSKEQELLQL